MVQKLNIAKAQADLVLGSSERASILRPELVGKISLAVTSPPYHNAISYESHVSDPLSNYREREEIDYAAEYLPFLARVWDECWKMLSPGGHLAINVGSVLSGGKHTPLPQDVQLLLRKSNFEWQFIRNIIWNKVTAGVKRAGSVIQHQMPGYWYPNIMTEHIIVVRKPGPRRALSKSVPSEWWEDVWDLAPVPPRTIEHPAPFPEDLPHRLIRMLTVPSAWVMDPFLGSGATSKAAVDLERNCLGFDIEDRYIKYAERRLTEPSLVRPAQLRVQTVKATEFVPGKSRGATRHGSGVKGRRSTVV